MIAAILLAAQTLATTAPPLAPQDWAGFPALAFRRPPAETPGISTFVAMEARSGHCTAATRTADGWRLDIEMAVLATARGQIRRVTPRAIDCPTVEQYAAGLLIGMARDNLVPVGSSDTWYRTSITFAWTG